MESVKEIKDCVECRQRLELIKLLSKPYVSTGKQYDAARIIHNIANGADILLCVADATRRGLFDDKQ